MPTDPAVVESLAGQVAAVLASELERGLAPVLARLERVEGAQLAHAAYVVDAGALRERLAGLEARPPVPGPAGAPGADGRDGVDGLSLADFDLTFDGVRTFTASLGTGDRRQERTITLPIPVWRGIYQAGQVYERGDLVTVGGSMWHCQADRGTTTRPETADGAPFWRLCVKRGDRR